MTDREHVDDADRRTPHAPRILAHASRCQRLTRHRFFLAYAYDAVTHTPLWLHWRSLLTYVRRARTVAWTLRIISFVFLALRAGTLVLLATALILVILPALVATMLAILLTARLESRRTNRLLLKTTQGRRVCVLFLTANAPNAFLSGGARDLVERGYTVILVSPYWISTRGMLERGRFYCTARAEAEQIYLVRRYYFFSLRRHVIAKRESTYVY